MDDDALFTLAGGGLGEEGDGDFARLRRETKSLDDESQRLSLKLRTLTASYEEESEVYELLRHRVSGLTSELGTLPHADGADRAGSNGGGGGGGGRGGDRGDRGRLATLREVMPDVANVRCQGAHGSHRRDLQTRRAVCLHGSFGWGKEIERVRIGL